MRASRFLTENAPKPRISTRSPPCAATQSKATGTLPASHRRSEPSPTPAWNAPCSTSQSSSDWSPSEEAWARVMAPGDTALDRAHPYPFFLAHPLEAQPQSLGALGGLARATGDVVRLLDAFGKDVVVDEPAA